MSRTNVFYRELLFKLLLVRHGETDANRQGLFQGRIDWPLNENGRAQIEQTAVRFGDYKIDHVYSSPAKRARETADILNAHWQAPIQEDKRLWEIDHLGWEGRAYQDVHDEDPQAWQDWLNLKIDAPHGGETLADTSARVQDWYEEMKLSHTGKEPTIAVVAHGGCLQVFLSDLLQTPHSNLWPYQFHNGSVAELWVFALGSKLTQLWVPEGDVL